MGFLNQRKLSLNLILILILMLLTCSGGAPDTAAMTGGKFSAGLSGCVRNLVLMNGDQQQAQTVDLQAYAASGFNVQPCSS